MVGEIYFTDQTPLLIKCPHYDDDDDDGDSCDDDDHDDVDDHDVIQTNAYYSISCCHLATNVPLLMMIMTIMTMIMIMTMMR